MFSLTTVSEIPSIGFGGSMPRKFQRTASKSTMLTTLVVVLIVGGAVASAVFLQWPPDPGSRSKSIAPLTFGPDASSASKGENNIPSNADLPDLKRAGPVAISGEDRKFSNDGSETGEANLSGNRTRSGIDSGIVANQPFAASKLPLTIAVSGNGPNTSNEAGFHSGGAAAGGTTFSAGFEGSRGAAMSDSGQAIGSSGLRMANEAGFHSRGAAASGTTFSAVFESSRGAVMSNSGQVIDAVSPGTSIHLAPDATIVWQGSTGNPNVWNLASNWVGGVQPTITDTAQFDNTADANNLAPSIGATNTSVGAILFAAGTTNSYNISGTGTLTLGSATVSGITNASDTNQTISITNISTPVNQTWSVTGAGNLSISSNVLAGATTTTLDNTGTGVGTISGVISGGGPVVKTGTGTWILAGANTFTGNIAVNAGTLLLNGSTPQGGGSVTVASGATYGGTGVLGGGTANTPRVTALSGGNVAPGNGGNNTGILVSNSLALNSGSNFLVDINGTTAGTGYDQYQVTASGASGGVCTFAGSNLVVTVGGTIGIGNIGQQFTILIRTNPSGNITLGDTFAGLPNGATFTSTNGFIFRINYNVQARGGDVVLTLLDIPEPSTWFMGGLAVTALVFSQRRRLKRLLLPG